MSISIASVGLGNTPVQTMTGASARMPTRQKMTRLFDQIDTAGSGSITRAQFTKAFQTMNPPAAFQALGPSTVFSALDTNGSGSVSKADFVNAMSTLSQNLSQAPTADSGDAPAAATAAAASTGTRVNTTA
jgi:hypothetical protein